MSELERFGPTRRGGPVFRWLGEPLAIDLANTVMVLRDGGEAVDLIATQTDLTRWLRVEGERLGSRRTRSADLETLRELRDAVRELLTAVAEGERPSRSALATVNAASEGSPASPLLAVEPASERGAAALRQAESDGDDSPGWLLGRLARATIELLTGPDAARLQICRAPSCGMFYVGTRRWCCSACGNRARAARHYEKRRAAATAPR